MTGPVTELHVWGVDRVGPALVRMATGRRSLRPGGRGHDGLRFAKLLGTGSGETFTVRDADPHHWAVLTVWDDAAAADRFATGPLVRSWDDAARERLRVRLRPFAARGAWSRRAPFEPWGGRGGSDAPVAAVTRARLRPTRALGFWRAVPPVSADLGRSPGLRLSLGIGEAPVGLQGTFSLWESAQHLHDFAWAGAAHRDVVERTARERWYAEELFARFAVLDVEGTYRGSAP